MGLALPHEKTINGSALQERLGVRASSLKDEDGFYSIFFHATFLNCLAVRSSAHV